MKKILVLIAIFAFANIAGVHGNMDGVASRSGWHGVYTLYPGDYYSYTGILYDDWPTEWDGWGFVCIGAGTFTANTVDCCDMGDTMINLVKDYLSGQWVDYDYCTSPCTATVSAGHTGAYGVYMVLTGYLDCPSDYRGYHIGASFDGQRDLPDTGIGFCYGDT